MSKQKELLEKLEQKAQGFSDKISHIKKQGVAERIEVDVLAQQVREMYETIYQLGKAEAEVKETATPKIPEDEKPTPASETEEGQRQPEELVNSEMHVVKEEEKKKEKAEEESAADTNSEKEEKAALIGEEKEDKSLAGKMTQKPISNLKSAIGINERFAFVNQLFNGDSNDYNEYLAKLNSFDTKEEAMELLDQLQQEFEWDEKDTTVKAFRSYVERRYL